MLPYPFRRVKCRRFYNKYISTWSTIIIVIRNGKIVWKRGPYCWYFRLNLKYLRWPYRAYIKKAKNGNFCEELLSENDFEAVLATFCCYTHGAKAPEAVQEISTDQKEYRKCSLCAVICWIVKIYLSIINSENGWLQGYLRRSWKSCWSCTENWPMVSFIHNGSEITTWMGHSFKSRSTKSRTTFLR